MVARLSWPLTIVASVSCLLACASSSEGVSETELGETVGSETDAAEETDAAVGDGDGDYDGDGDGDGDDLRPAHLAVTADWRSKRLSLLDYAALRDGATTREAALWKTIELPEHEPGPLEVELTPDGRLALVAISPGFFAGAAGGLVGAGELPVGGALLIVEIDSGMILAELATAHYPMGIALAPDGATAWTANYGGNGQSGTTMSVIDLVELTIVDEFEIGPGPEQLDVSADGSLGIINTAGDGSIRVFETAAPGSTLSPPLAVSADPSWVLLLDDPQQRAVSINSLGPPGYSLIDVSDPSAPSVLDTVSVAGVAYAVAPGAASHEILLSIYAGTSISLQMFDVDTGEVVEQIDVPIAGFPLGIVYAPDDELALIPAPGANALIVADFATLEYRTLDWQTEPGPTYVTLE